MNSLPKHILTQEYILEKQKFTKCSPQIPQILRAA